MLFAREGARVMLVDYNHEAAEETKRLIDEEGGGLLHLPGRREPGFGL